VSSWKRTEDARLRSVGKSLSRLGLTWKVDAVDIAETQVELRVGRTNTYASSGARDLVNIADVGFGISQTLPVVVALLTAQPGQVVYLEQPEVHLHPRAQLALAELLADAARRKVIVVAETHSDTLVLGIQTLVAHGKLDPGLVKMHWFERDDTGATKVTSADIDESGDAGDWPEDFSDVSIKSKHEFLKASSKH